VTGVRGAGVGVFAGRGVTVGAGAEVVGLASAVGLDTAVASAGAGVCGTGAGGVQAVSSASSAKRSRAARTEPYALSRLKNSAMRSYNTLRCSGSEGSSRS
jgi:hypothetical protein